MTEREFAYTETTSLEMTPKNVSKGSGLKLLAKHLGIEIQDVVVVGDAENDRTMFETAGFSVAMGNALDAIKAIADAVVADNDHNGVGEAIRKYLM
ncbi:MAG: HAD-IIB family hydrolase [Lachnospiraceae bacterium]|nr:HAD-IIB family hydrolase [Lachnospiraceae bacterium]